MLAYFKLMLRNRLAAFKPASLHREGRSRAKVVLSYAGYALLALVLYGAVIALEMLVFSAAESMGDTRAVFSILFLMCTFVTLLYGFFNIASTLFFSKDNAFVASLPISSRGILTAKLLSVLAGEIGLTVAIGLPLVVRYGISVGAGVVYYAKSLVGMLLVPVVPMAVAALLSFLLIRVSALWKRRESLTVIMSFVLMIGLITLQMQIQMNAAQDESQVTSMMMGLLFGQNSLSKMFEQMYPPIGWLTSFMTGSGVAAWGSGLLFAALCVASLTLVVLLFGGGYLTLALRQEETLRRANAGAKRIGKDSVRTPFQALYRQEMRDVITVPVYATNCLAGFVMFPVIIVIALVNIKNMLGEGTTSFVNRIAQMLPGEWFMVIATAVICFTTTMNMAVSTAVSREGKQHDFRRVLPVSGATQLGAKLAMGMTYNVIGSLLGAAVLWVMLPMYWLPTLIALVVSQAFSLLSCASTLLLDVYRPRLKWKTETEAVKQSTNAMLSMLISIVQVAALVGVFVLLMRLGLQVTAAFAVTVAVMVIADFAMVRWVRGRGAMTYCLREYTN